jgi:hypothetical protein
MSEATGYQAIAMGEQNKATGSNSSVLGGTENTASGDNSSILLRRV